MSRTIDDLPPVASDDELMAWGRALNELPESPESTETWFLPEDFRLGFDDVLEDLDDDVDLRKTSRPLVADRSRTRMSTDEIFLEVSTRAAAVYQRRRVTARR